MRSATHTLRILKLKSPKAMGYLFCAFEIMDVVSTQASTIAVAERALGSDRNARTGQNVRGASGGLESRGSRHRSGPNYLYLNRLRALLGPLQIQVAPKEE
jgi:hypothetical protein